MHVAARKPGRSAVLVAVVALTLWIMSALLGSPAHAAAPDDRGSDTKGKSAAAHDNGRGNDERSASKGSSSNGASDHSDGTSGTSGDVNEPQPVSNADANEGGANGECPGGPYCSTRDGSPSGNGNGKGEAKGKPCAGCVGKADNKNPKGQYPNGSDHNAGYECDRNHGIGRSNPAHTGCTSGPYPTPPPGGGDDDCVESAAEDCGETGGNGGSKPGKPTKPGKPACTGGTMTAGTCVLGAAQERRPRTEVGSHVAGGSGPQTGAEVLSAQNARALPFTGAPVGLLLAAGGLLTASGLALTVGTRTRGGVSG